MGTLVVGVFGVALIVGYFALGIWATRKSWAWSSALRPHWARVLIASTVLSAFFTPGIVGAGHGVGIVPAWLMFATGSFSDLTAESKKVYLVSLIVCWLLVVGVGLLVTFEERKK